MEELTRLTESFKAKCGFDLRDSNVTANKVRILARVPTNRMGDWLAVMDRILEMAAITDKWTVDLSKLYLRPNGKTVYTWRVIIQVPAGRSLQEALVDIANISSGAVKSGRGLTMEMVLGGASPNRHAQGSSGKGAGPVGSLTIGRRPS